MPATLQDLTHALLEAALRAGADAADALAMDGASIGIDLRAGALEKAERAEGTDMGLRVLIGGRQACVSVSDTSPATILAVAERAVAMAREAPEDPYVGLATADQITRAWDLAALDMTDPTPEPSAATLEETARRAEAAAMSATGITQVEASASYWRRDMHLAATNGFSGGYGRTGHSISAVAFTGSGTGMERDWAAEGRTYLAELPSAEEIGHQAATRALERVGATKPKTGTYSVVYDERVSSSLIGHLLSAINGNAISRGASWLLNGMDSQVLPEHLSLTEDPHRPRMSGSRPFDAEGLPTTKRTIVDAGILRTWTLDLATARKLGLTSTANAARGPSSPPSPSTSNIDLSPGTHSRADLIRDMGTGLLITSMIGSTINPTTGDYSRGASGFWVENGEILYPVNECTIAGNLRDMLKRIIPANDARAHLSMRVPSLLVEGMILAGA